VSVLIDATVVRLLLVPAVMTLLGRHAWWTPRWLDRIMPHIDAEGGGAVAQPPAHTPSERPSGVGGPAGAPRPGLRRNARRQGPRALPPCTCRGGSGAAPDTSQDEEAEDHQHSADRGRPELRAGLGEAAALGLRPGRLLQLRKGAGHLGRLGGLAPVLAVLAVVAAGARFLAVVRGGRRLHVGLSGLLGALVVRRLLGGRGLRRLLA